MEQPILITWLNDFLFCPVSIYFHNLYGNAERIAFQEPSQINGTSAHAAIDGGRYSNKKSILCGLVVYCEEYGLMGKIDTYDIKTAKLIERKKRIVKVYDGYIYQLYGQYFALREMGYQVKNIALYSLDDNKSHPVSLPEEDEDHFVGFRRVINEIRTFTLSGFTQTNIEKCRHCIYEPLCDSSLAENGGGHV